MKEIHIGEIIKKKVAERALSINALAKAINCDRTNIYKIYKRKSIDIELLIRISEVLKYDFISEIYQQKEKSHPPNLFSNCLIEINENTVRITKCDDETVVATFNKSCE